MKYRIIQSREENLEGKYFHETDDENIIEDNIFYESWTDDPAEYEKDDTIIILVVEVQEIRHVRHREYVDFSISPLGGYRLPIRVPSELH